VNSLLELDQEKKDRRRKNGLKGHTNEWKGFIDIELSEQDKAMLADWKPEDKPDLMVMLQEAMEGNYKLSLSPDKLHNCVIATLTGREGCGENEGYSLNARGPDVPGALLALYYKQVCLCEGKAWLVAGNAFKPDQKKWG